MRARSACLSRRSCSRVLRLRCSAAWTLGLPRQGTPPPSRSISGRPSSACCLCGSMSLTCPGRPSPSKPIDSSPRSSDSRRWQGRRQSRKQSSPPRGLRRGGAGGYRLQSHAAAGKFGCRGGPNLRTLPGMSAPPAEGARVAWQDVPSPVRGAIERVCGAPVIEAETQPGGFSPGVAARVRCADGTRHFVKAVSAEVNQESRRLHRREASVLADLDPAIAGGRVPAPRLRGTAELAPWFALVTDDVAGHHPALPWRADELGPVLAALGRLAEVPAP